MVPGMTKFGKYVLRGVQSGDIVYLFLSHQFLSERLWDWESKTCCPYGENEKGKQTMPVR